MMKNDQKSVKLKLCLLRRKTYSTACAKTSMNGISFCCTYICVYSKEKMFAGIESCIFAFVFDMPSGISPTKNLIKVPW